MKHLPVPPLRQSLDRFLAAVRPLSDSDQQRRAEAVAEHFAATQGHDCQGELMRFAHQENAADRSWLSQAWLSSYLANRDPLPMTSSVGFRIRLLSGLSGTARAADAIHRISVLHLCYLRGEIDEEVTPRGDVIDMHQWKVLAGGLRHPQPGEDVIREGRLEAASREIGVLWQGRWVMMPISDAAGQPLSRAVLKDALHRLQELPSSDDATFTHLSYLGSDRAAACLDILTQRPENVHTYDRVVHAVFAVNLTDTQASEEEHQERVTFHPGQAWAYKPFTYQISLVDDYVGVHVEHSVVDGVTLKSMLALLPTTHLVDSDGDSHGSPIPLEPLTWAMPDDLRSQLSLEIAAYQRNAGSHRVRILRFPAAVPTDLPFRVSHDATQQFILLYAQVATYGRARSTYEAVDMREYQAGRTECLRPVTADALALIEALLRDGATPDHLYAALAAHRAQVVACKSGQGFDRHLSGLRLMAGRIGLKPPLFDDESYTRVTTDFLSTTSVGDAEQIVRFTFAPTSHGGIGVNYTVSDGMYEFCLSHNADQSERIDDFIHGIEAGATALGQLLVNMRDG